MSNLSKKLNNTSIRSRLLLTIFMGLILMSSIMIYITRMVNISLNSVGNSYITNIELQEYGAMLNGTEKAMEEYVQYRTFEAIDTYYQFKAKTEAKEMSFALKPSLDTIKMQEYKVRRLVESLLYYTNLTVSAKRANNIVNTSVNFDAAVGCYGVLNSALEKLNMMYFTQNAEVYERNRERIAAANRNSVVLIVCVSLLVLSFAYIVVRNITQPLVEISEVAHRVAERDFDVPLFKRDTYDEIGNICRAFNRMIISIREYIDTIWEKAIHENELREREIEMTALYKEAQLRALQGQINPHFLFNTLNTGAQLAMMESADKTCYFLEQTADFYRYNIQQEDQDSTLQDELQILEKYIYIMKVRFGARFEFIIKVDSDSRDCSMPSMILQPLVENCIKHGLRDMAKGGIVKVEVKKLTDFIRILISDNGCGISETHRKHILFDQNQGIGLSNVLNRLRLFYRSDNVFDIQANPEGQGTLFIIRIPNV